MFPPRDGEPSRKEGAGAPSPEPKAEMGTDSTRLASRRDSRLKRLLVLDLAKFPYAYKDDDIRLLRRELQDQLKSLDWLARRATLEGRVPAAVLRDLRARIAVLLGM